VHDGQSEPVAFEGRRFLSHVHSLDVHTPAIVSQEHLILTNLQPGSIFRSKELLAISLTPGKVMMLSQANWRKPVVEVGEQREGKWVKLAELPVKMGKPTGKGWTQPVVRLQFEVDALNAGELMVIRERDGEPVDVRNLFPLGPS
jgi:hypothetical protein